MNEERWQVKALNFLREFASFGCQFMAEEARSYAYHHGLPEPKSHRAWGSVVREARKKGLIYRVGFQCVRNPAAHRTPATLWQKCGMREGRA